VAFLAASHFSAAEDLVEGVHYNTLHLLKYGFVLVVLYELFRTTEHLLQRGACVQDRVEAQNVVGLLSILQREALVVTQHAREYAARI